MNFNFIGKYLTTTLSNEDRDDNSNSFEFRDKSNTGSEYTYDNNGNMIRDLNSKIDFIEYDKLDHPIRIQFMDGSNIQYVYAADGRKLKVTHQTAVDNLTVSANRKLNQPETQQKTTRLPAVDNTIVSSDRKLDLSESQLKSQTVQYYMGNFVLTNGILDRYYFGSDGYAKFTNGKPVYSSRIKGYTYSTVKSSDVLLNPEYRVTQNVYPYYFVKDHLGSNRMVADNPSTMVSYYPYGGIYYDDILFYQADDNHLYNGKEMDRMYGLDWLHEKMGRFSYPFHSHEKRQQAVCTYHGFLLLRTISVPY